jgi:hypothetical protein
MRDVSDCARGQLQGKEKKPSLVLEAAVDSRRRIWHFYFGSAGTNNGIIIRVWTYDVWISY